MDRTIKVTGKGKISVKPDQILLNLYLEDVKEKLFASNSIFKEC